MKSTLDKKRFIVVDNIKKENEQLKEDSAPTFKHSFSQTNYSNNSINENKLENQDTKNDYLKVLEENIIPKPFFIDNEKLFAFIKKDEITMICRQIPIVEKQYENIENNKVFYELSWKDKSIKKKEIVSASTISTKKELIQLSDKGFAVNDLNYKNIIKFLDNYIDQNEIETQYMVNRLGHVKRGFIHPNIDTGLTIMPQDSGEQSLLNAFRENGTVESWKTEVLEKIKKHPKALFYTIASFTAPLLHDLSIDSFLVDFSGHTSQGKTTLLRLSSTVWGTQELINEWNTTKVAIERKAGFLNSFPLLMDDTKKANKNQLQDFIYMFSGGKSKGRGSLTGFQQDRTWKTILLSTGESSILEYAQAAGVAGRVITLEDEPFGKTSYEFLSELYDAMNKNFGIVGRSFLEKWLKIESEDKKNLIKIYHELRNQYVKEAQSNEVLIRLSAYYAAIHFTASILNTLLGFNIDTNTFEKLFKTHAKENKAIDKPKQLLEELLERIDSFRATIHYGIEPKQTYAIFKNNNLYLTPAFTKLILEAEEKATRKEWLKRGYTITQKNGLDYTTVKIKGKAFKGIQVNNDIIEELGFDFTEEEAPPLKGS
ncbi:DUF927 domain-containing protein [Bacillus cereus group sp. BfR-BA-01312]|uniref:DUF927 domain-containing protein n=1 Tax=Bacillus cereus group sp. BfR-BA-01312 TaxID=2920289 RepID=UPI001F5890DA|nr:DUF927 domain-containing protein [Bacillus cereus group sp. BfR-BA-01312]MDA2130792.1 DUF927 domain-containing protein [Bacillus cereus]MDA2526444.1 DUF927 domain-containing protein [Bacillus cereus]